MIDSLLDNRELYLMMLVSALFGLYLMSIGLRQLARERYNILTVQKSRSCFQCDEHFVLAPGYAPHGNLNIVVKETVARCRRQMQDEVRLSEEEFQKDWEWAFEQPAGDYTAIATRCPKFRVIQGGKK